MRLIASFVILSMLSFVPAVQAKTPIISWDQLTLVGGFKVPAGLIDGKNTRYTSGSFDLLPGSTNTTGKWVSHHGVGGYIAEYSEPNDPSMDFNELILGRHAGPTLRTVDPSQPWTGEAVQWIDADNVITSGRRHYRYNASWTWASTVNLNTGVETLLEIGHVDDTFAWDEGYWDAEETAGTAPNAQFALHNAFGRGFTRIPSDWATANTGGKTIGMAAGGYDVLNSPIGPAIAAYAVGDTLPITILNYNTPASHDGDGLQHYEIRDTNYSFPDYETTPLELWSTDINTVIGSEVIGSVTGVLAGDPPILGPTGDVGYMTADVISAGAGWIDDPTYSGVVFGVLSPNGFIDYDTQGAPGTGAGAFAVGDSSLYYDGNTYHYTHDTAYADGPDATYTRNLYVYDPECLAQATAGTIDYWDCPPTIITPDFSGLPWTPTPSTSDSQTEIAGVTWDNDRSLLWLTLTQMYDDNKYAVMVAYELNGSAAPKYAINAYSFLGKLYTVKQAN